MQRGWLVTLSFLLMESFIAFVLAAVLAAGAGGAGPAYPTVLLATLGGYGVVKLLHRFDFGIGFTVVAGILLSILPLLVLLNVQYNPSGSPFSLGWLTGFAEAPDGYLTPRWPQVWGVLICIIAWFRSVQLAQQSISYGTALTSFSVGVVGIALAMIMGQGSRAADAINLAALPFFVFGILALGLLQMRRTDRPDSETLNGPWLAVLVGTVITLALVSAFLGLVPLALFNFLLAPVGRLTLWILDLVIFIIAVPIGWVLTWIIVNVLGNPSFEFPQVNQVASDAAQRNLEEGDPNRAVIVTLFLLKVLFLVVLAALIGYVLYRVFRRLRRPERDPNEVRESVERLGGFGDDLNALFAGLARRFRRTSAEREPPLSPNILRLRRLYVKVLDDAAERGTVRPPPATPHEFAPTLTRTFADPAPDTLSDRFAAARYGRMEPSASELDALERDVRRMEQHRA